MNATITLNDANIELEIGKVLSVDNGSIPDNEFIYFEKMKDGKWRMTCTKNTIEVKNLRGKSDA